MTRREFMSALEENLRGMSDEELKSILEYYEEYFDEAGEDREASVIEELGSPKRLGVMLSGENAVRSLDDTEEMKGSEGMPVRDKTILRTLLIVLALVIGSPILFPVLIVVISLIFAAVVVVLALGFSAIAVLVSAVVALFTGNFVKGLFALGSALLIAGFAVLCAVAVIGIIKAIKRLILSFGKKRLIKESAENE